MLLKAVDEAANDSTEEWLRAVRYAARGGSDGLGCEPLLTALTTQPDRRIATVSQQARRLEAALMCVAELAAPPVSDAAVTFQENLLDELLAPGESSPLGHPSRAMREEAAKLAAQLIGAHGGDGEVADARFAGARAKAQALLAQFVQYAPDACQGGVGAPTLRREAPRYQRRCHGARRRYRAYRPSSERRCEEQAQYRVQGTRGAGHALARGFVPDGDSARQTRRRRVRVRRRRRRAPLCPPRAGVPRP